MGIVVIAGKVLKVVGEFLSEEEIAEFIESQTKEGLEKLAKKFGVSLIRRKKILVKKISDASLNDLEISEPLQNAISKSLADLPPIIVNISADIEGSELVLLKENGIVVKLVAVPRFLVVKRFSSRISNTFKDNFELLVYEDLLNQILFRTITTYENEFFENIKSEIEVSKQVYLIGQDHKYQWGENKLSGHYYVATGSPEYNRSVTETTLMKLKQKIGCITSNQMDSILRRLNNMF